MSMGLLYLQKNCVHFDSAGVKEIPWTILLFPDSEYFFFSDWKKVTYNFYRKKPCLAGIISLCQAISSQLSCSKNCRSWVFIDLYYIFIYLQLFTYQP